MSEQQTFYDMILDLVPVLFKVKISPSDWMDLYDFPLDVADPIRLNLMLYGVNDVEPTD
jgi:hypothetical protein